MKKLLALVIFLIGFQIAKAQYTYIAQRYEWYAGLFRGLGVPSGAGPAAFISGQAQRAGALYYDSVGVDSGLYVWSGLVWRQDGGYTDADARAAISLTTTGTSGAATYSSATGVFNIPVYAGTLNTNVGAFYRWLKPATQEIKTFAAGYGILLDSTTNTDAITAVLDSTTVFPHIRSTIAPNLLFDSLGAAGISPMTTWNNTLYARRISIAGGSIDTTASGGLLITVTGGGGITTLNTLTGATQTFATGTTGTAPNISSSGTTHTFNFPDAASSVTQGMITNGTQTIFGVKTANSNFTTASKLYAIGGIFSYSISENNSNFMVPNPNTIAGAQTVSQYQYLGSTNSRARIFNGGNTTSVLAAGEVYSAGITGNQPVTEGTSGNHPFIGTWTFKPPDITGGTATVDRTATVQITGPATATVVEENSSLWVHSGNVRLGRAGTSIGTMSFEGNTSGKVTLTPAAAAGTWTMTLPTTGGTNGYFLQTNGSGVTTWAAATKPTLTKNAMVENPTATENLFMFRTPVAITVTDVTAVLVGGTPSVTYNIAFGTDRTSATNVYTAGQTVTSETTGTAASGVNDATIPAGSWVWITTSAATDVTQLNISLTYTED